MSDLRRSPARARTSRDPAFGVGDCIRRGVGTRERALHAVDMMTPLKDRPTADLIVIALTGVVCAILLISMVGLVLLEIYRPEVDIGTLAARVATLTSTLIGAIVGYVAGRNQGSDVDR